MKKTYILPTIEVQYLEVTQIIALSIISNGVADDSDALVKSDDWDIWNVAEGQEE